MRLPLLQEQHLDLVTSYSTLLHRLSILLIIRAFKQLGYSPNAGEILSSSSLVSSLSISPTLQRCLAQYLSWLSEDGFLTPSGSSETQFVVTSAWPSLFSSFDQEFSQLQCQLLSQYARFASSTLLMLRVGMSLDQLLLGKEKITDIADASLLTASLTDDTTAQNALLASTILKSVSSFPANSPGEYHV